MVSQTKWVFKLNFCTALNSYFDFMGLHFTNISSLLSITPTKNNILISTFKPPSVHASITVAATSMASSQSYNHHLTTSIPQTSLFKAGTLKKKRTGGGGEDSEKKREGNKPCLLIETHTHLSLIHI